MSGWEIAGCVAAGWAGTMVLAVVATHRFGQRAKPMPKPPRRQQRPGHGYWAEETTETVTPGPGGCERLRAWEAHRSATTGGETAPAEPTDRDVEDLITGALRHLRKAGEQ